MGDDTRPRFDGRAHSVSIIRQNWAAGRDPRRHHSCQSAGPKLTKVLGF
jgi:hypothetical protein